MDADGSQQFHLVDADGYSWSPDSKRIVFAVEHHQGEGIFVINVDGSLLTRLADDYGYPKPAWSPDGRSILVGSMQQGLYTMHPDGSQHATLLVPGFDWSSCCGLPWSPNSKQIAFKMESGIYVMDSDGSNHIRLTDGEDYEPQWSPDGTLIAFVRLTIGNRLHLYVMNADGSQQVDIGDGNLFAWAPNGRRIAYDFLEGDNEAIDVLDLDTHGIFHIANAREPDW